MPLIVVTKVCYRIYPRYSKIWIIAFFSTVTVNIVESLFLTMEKEKFGHIRQLVCLYGSIWPWFNLEVFKDDKSMSFTRHPVPSPEEPCVNPIPTEKGLIWSRWTNPARHFYSFMARVTKIFAFIYFQKAPEGLFFEKKTHT